MTLVGISLLLLSCAGLFVRGWSRRMGGPIAAASGASRGLLERTLSAAARFERFQYLGGTSARLERLHIPIGRGGADPVVDADLHLDVSTMSLDGVMDGAPIARRLLSGYVPFLSLADGSTVPVRFQAPVSSFARASTWKVSMDSAGQQVVFQPSTFLRPVPLDIAGGRVAFQGGALELDGLDIGFGGSRIRVAAAVADALRNPTFERARVSGDLDLFDLLLARGAVRPPGAVSKLALELAVSGGVARPRVTGSARGALDLPALPISVATAGLPDRFVTMKFPKIEANVTGGDSGALLQAEVLTGPGAASINSPTRQLGFRGESARAATTVSGSWRSPVVTQALELLHGIVEYRTPASFGPLRSSTAGIEFPYQRLRLSSDRRDRQTRWHFDATTREGGAARVEYTLDDSRLPAASSYGIDLQAVDLGPLSAALFGGRIAMKGKVSLKAEGRAKRMALADMKGAGAGRITDFAVDWRSPTGSLEDLDLFELVRDSVVPVAQIEAPSVGTDLVLKIAGPGHGFRVEGQVRLNANLAYQGKFDYTFEPWFLKRHPAADVALMRRGSPGKLVLKFQGEAPEPPGIELHNH